MGLPRHAKLADFGLARRVQGAEAPDEDPERGLERVVSMTRNAGTRAFMPMEDAAAGVVEHQDSSSSDLSEILVWRELASRDWYAFGCCLLLMLLGLRGGRLSPQRAVLLPPAPDVLHAVVREHAPELGAAAGPVLALTQQSASGRAGGQELRASAFLSQAIAAADEFARPLLKQRPAANARRWRWFASPTDVGAMPGTSGA
mmetsp:Transcript_73086/g.211560  ORF Transcript_73086/g.211560 Transcript_73086/m.211560 type:complete len:202 (+) Transcript_73086:1368-1973(+)